MGTPEFAVPILTSLIEKSRHEVVVVVTGCDKPAGRHLRLCSTPVKMVAESYNLPILQPDCFTDPLFLERLASYRPDIGVVVAFRILPEEVYSIPPLGCVNLHGSLLPELRGAAPINWAIMRGYTETGLTTFSIASKVDTGNILLQEKVGILPEDNFDTLAGRMCSVGSELVIQTLNGLEDGLVHPVPQQGKATSAPKLTRDICLIKWEKPAHHIHNRIRGLAPSPSAFSSLGGKTVKLFSSALWDSANTAPPGTTTGFADGMILVQTGSGCLGIRELQLEGKKRMTAVDFIKGYPLPVGTVWG